MARAVLRLFPYESRGAEVMLADAEWSAWSNREIARRCVVTNTLVDVMRRDATSASGLQPDKNESKRNYLYAGKVRTMTTSNIDPGCGRAKALPASPELQRRCEAATRCLSIIEHSLAVGRIDAAKGRERLTAAVFDNLEVRCRSLRQAVAAIAETLGLDSPTDG